MNELRRTAAPMRRRPRMSAGRVRRWEALWPRYGIEPAQVAEFAPDVLDIGFGGGESVRHLTARQPPVRVLAVEVYRPGIIAVMRHLDEAEIDRVRVAAMDVFDLLPAVPAGSLRLVQAFFPDPWPKRRHAGRRLLRPDTIPALVARLADGGVLHVATDCAPYADDVAAICATVPLLHAVPPPARPATRYEAAGVAAGRHAHDLAWRRVDIPDRATLAAAG